MAEMTLLWHDYETWGVDPRRDRPSQFAAIRTNEALEELGEPLMFFCRPTPDFLPHPQAVLVTGITPQHAAEQGVNEAEFFRRIDDAFSQPGTCGVGYNSIRFDDEVTRFGLYRNFHDPYAREWQNGNSRWDILDLVRMTHALRPEGIEWPSRDDGTPSFRLEHLTAANNIAHEGAHDALVDVRATIAMARLIREKQPRLYDFYFKLRRKDQAAAQLNLQSHEMVLHVSGMFPASEGCIAPVVPLLAHPRNKNEVIVYNLRHDPAPLLAMSAEQIGELLYTPTADLPEGVGRPALKSVHLNKSPALAPLSTLSDEARSKWGLDLDRAAAYREQLLADPALNATLGELYRQSRDWGKSDADSALYDGFIDNGDRRSCERLLAMEPTQLAGWEPLFDDPRLNTLYPRYKARNYPELLTDEERQQWQEFCRARLADGAFGSTLTLDGYQQAIESLLQQGVDERQAGLLQKLVEWVQ